MKVGSLRIVRVLDGVAHARNPDGLKVALPAAWLPPGVVAGAELRVDTDGKGGVTFFPVQRPEARPGDPTWRVAIRDCRLCHEAEPPLVHPAAKPLLHEEGDLGADVLFVAEAPNREDTLDPAKGRITVSAETDPSGRFFHERLTFDLELDASSVYVTNAVVCLPASSGGLHPVKAGQRHLCSVHLRATVEGVDPAVVVTLGVKALDAVKAVERHRLKLRDDVARPHRWFGRLLFPLYHPSRLGRVTRSAAAQAKDYRELRLLLDRLVERRGPAFR